MSYSTDFCFICQENNTNIKNILHSDNEGITVQTKLICFIPEYIHLTPEISQNICTNCIEILNNIYLFKQKCLISIAFLNEYIHKLKQIYGSNNYLPITLSDIIYYKESLIVRQNFQIAESTKSRNTDFREKIKRESFDREKYEDLNQQKDANKIEYMFIKAENTSEVENVERQSSEQQNVGENLVYSEGIEDIIIKQEPEINSDDNTQLSDMESSNEAEQNNNSNDSESSSADSAPPSDQKDLTSSPKKVFTCSQCQKSFQYRCDLAVHLRTHTGERPYECPTCHKKFTTSGSVNRHKQTHTGAKPHVCEVCKKSFCDLSNLVRHKRTHDSVLGFQCTICFRSFAEGRSLTVHLRTHSGDKPYQCDLCPYKCTSSGNLNQHSRVHTGLKPYKCRFCDKCFAHSTSLNYHVRAHHRDSVYL